jgi:hypothetical protein
MVEVASTGDTVDEQCYFESQGRVRIAGVGMAKLLIESLILLS